MKAIPFPTKRRNRGRIFADGSKLVRLAEGGYLLVEAQPKYASGESSTSQTSRHVLAISGPFDGDQIRQEME